MLRIFILALALTTSATMTTAAGLKADKASKSLCTASDFQHSFEGVWFENKVAKLLYRVSFNDDKTGCYAWLNKQKSWRINNIGASVGQVRKIGAKYRFKNENVVIELFPKEKRATFKRTGAQYATLGSIF